MTTHPHRATVAADGAEIVISRVFAASSGGVQGTAR